MIQTFAMDFRTVETMDICTANSRTTDNSVIGRRHLPLSLFDTSIQLCPSVHLRLRCRADRTAFTEDSKLYIVCQEQRLSCVKRIDNSYLARNRTIRTCNKLKTMSGTDVTVAGCAMPKLHFCGLDQNCYCRDFHGKLIPSCSLPVMTFCNSWMWRPHTGLLLNTLDRLLPGLCSFGVSQNYPYARFMMACFQRMFRRSANCVRSRPTVCESYDCNSSSMNTEVRPFINCYSSVGRHCVSEANSVPVMNDCNSASSSGDDACNATSESEVVQHGNTSTNVSSNNKMEKLSPGCTATVRNHFVTVSLTDDDAEDSDDDADNDGDDDDDHSLSKAKTTNIVSGAPCITCYHVERQTSTDGNQVVSSFFIRASDSDASSYSDSDASDNDDDDDDGDWDDSAAEAASDDESDCWYSDDDECWTSRASTAHCVLVDLDPLKINGLYIPQTSNVPVSPSRCQYLPLESTAEIETESERALKLINDRWRQWYSDDVKIKRTPQQQRHAKHVCILTVVI